MPFIQLNRSIRLHYELIRGEPAKPVLVFLHEGLGCTAMWTDFIRVMCRRTGCPGLAYDRQGYGRSAGLTHPRTADYLKDYAENELPRVLDHLIPGKPYILVGHSDGGTISLIHGAAQPETLEAVVTMAAHVFVDAVTLAGIRQAVRAWEDGKLEGLARFHGRKTQQTFRAWSDTWLAPWFREWNVENVLPKIQAPLLVIQGKEDQYGTREQVEAICSGTGGPATPLMIPDCGHSPHADQPGAVVQAIMAFVGRNAPNPVGGKGS